MADPQTPAAAVTPAPTPVAAPVQPTGTPADDGYERISRDELQTLRRERERARGMDGFFQKANQYGLKRPEDLDNFGKFQETLKGKKLTMDQIARALQDEQSSSGEGGGGLDMAALEKHFGSKYIPADQFESKLSEREKLIEARFEHKQSLSKESEMVSKAIAELAGDKATPRDQWLIKNAVMGIVNDFGRREQYPDGHPLRGSEFAPYTEQSLGKIVAEVKKELGLTAGEEVAKIADEAAKKGGRVSTPAGSTPGASTRTPDKSTTDHRPGGKPSVAAIEALYTKQRASRGQGPVSSISG